MGRFLCLLEMVEINVRAATWNRQAQNDITTPRQDPNVPVESLDVCLGFGLSVPAVVTVDEFQTMQVEDKLQVCDEVGHFSAVLYV